MSVDDARMERMERALMELLARSAATQATLEAHTRQQAERTANRDKRCDDHEGRLRVVEDTGAEDHGKQIVALQEEVRGLREWRIKLVAMAAGVATLVSTPLGAAGLAVAQAVKK